ncbi:MAG: FAD-dependent oxidoreductase [Candidatus Eiseniibacteriota bacterium]|nr:MAG: FAD-dependent oxidoreductase [Candidatus Eisenbacteria bacterium]
MQSKGKRVVIIGGGAVGPKAASRARRLEPDADIKIIERGKFISYAACGMPYYISGDISDSRELIARDAAYFKDRLDVDVLTETEVLSIDRKAGRVNCRETGGREFPLPYDALVVATGAEPFVPPLEGRELTGIFKLKGIPDAIAIRDYLKKEEPRKAAIVGAGLIGLEMAEAFRARGLSVTVVEMLDWPLPALLDFEIATILGKYLEEEGVNLVFSRKATGFDGTPGGRVKRLRTEDGPIDCDVALISIGVRPNTSLAAEAGLELGPARAIAVNEFLQTNDPAIYAGGDCVECKHLVTGKPAFVPLGSTANKHGRVIGNNVVGGRDVFPGILGTAIAKVLGMAVGRTGLTEREAVEAGYKVVCSTVTPNDIAHYYPGGNRITLKLVADGNTGRVLGAQCVGKGEVAKRIDVLATALSSGMSATDLANLDLSYAPPYNSAMDAIHHAANVIRNKMDGTARSIPPQQLKDKMNGQENLVILDVRSEREWRELRLGHSKVRHVPMERLSQTAARDYEGKEIVTLCKSSVRAYHAQKMLERKGLSDVKFLDGSLLVWPYDVKKSK